MYYCFPRRLLIGAALAILASAQDYKPIDSLNVEAYMGRWYQMYTTIGFKLLELGGICVTADYTLRSDGKIALVNQARPWLIPQTLARTKGFVAQSPTVEGAFTVDQRYLFTPNPDDTNFDEPGNYWIIGIGPIVNNEYQWVAISTPDKGPNFILARDPSGFKGSDYERDALAVFSSFGGFDGFFNKLRRTAHFFCFGYPNFPI